MVEKTDCLDETLASKASTSGLFWHTFKTALIRKWSGIQVGSENDSSRFWQAFGVGKRIHQKRKHQI